jgi:hypothetical protein
MKLVQTFAFAAVACIAWASIGVTGEANQWPAQGPVIRIDWQYPQELPRRFRNHCSSENFTARPYCSDHCGIDYQFYYCSDESFGCCHLGHGYCDWSGVLRCHP